MFELLVPATQAQLEKAGDSKAYDQQLRPDLMIGAIQALQDAGVEPDVWKIEGIDSRMIAPVLQKRHDVTDVIRLAALFWVAEKTIAK